MAPAEAGAVCALAVGDLVVIKRSWSAHTSRLIYRERPPLSRTFEKYTPSLSGLDARLVFEDHWFYRGLRSLYPIISRGFAGLFLFFLRSGVASSPALLFSQSKRAHPA